MFNLLTDPESPRAVPFETLLAGEHVIVHSPSRVEPFLSVLDAPPPTTGIIPFVARASQTGGHPSLAPTVVAALQQLDYTQHLAIVIADRVYRDGYYRLHVRAVTQSAVGLNLHVAVWQRPGGRLATNIHSQPHAIVVLNHDDLHQPVFQANLCFDNRVSASTPFPLQAQGLYRSLPFTVIAEGEHVGLDLRDMHGAGVWLLHSPQDVDTALSVHRPTVPQAVVGRVRPQIPHVIQVVREVDYTTAGVLVLVDQSRPTGSYRVQVQHVVQHGPRLVVHATAISPRPGMVVEAGMTRPYQVLRVKSNATGQTAAVVEFTLNGRVIAATEREA